MFRFSEESIDELLLWLSVNHDHVAQTRTPPTVRMQAALMAAFEKVAEEIVIEAPRTSRSGRERLDG